MSEQRLTILKKGETTEFSYDIVWKQDFSALADEIRNAGDVPARLCIVTDTNVSSLYLEEAEKSLAPLRCEICHWEIPAGEEHKNLSEIERIYEKLKKSRLDRKDMLVALGGGVVGDMTGFAAATYLRGIRFVQIPTTLLAEVDSSVGGKTGVDFDQYKNMVGAFYQPVLVYMNTDVLSTLSAVQFASGMAEVIKSALIRDASFLDWLEDNRTAVQNRDHEALARLIRCCCRIKAGVVEEDPKENGLRAILNFGHTIGHAVEKLSAFILPHGHSVAIGMNAALYLCEKRGRISHEDCERIRSLMNAYELPLTAGNAIERLRPEESDRISRAFSAEAIVDATKSDKKMEGGRIKFILLSRIGSAEIVRDVSDEELAEAAEFIL
ncbi:MAG: 3-dehydroquinate synthase [Bilifractor sp.]|jgi:3-dehydroquinate synthase